MSIFMGGGGVRVRRRSLNRDMLNPPPHTHTHTYAHTMQYMCDIWDKMLTRPDGNKVAALNNRCSTVMKEKKGLIYRQEIQLI